MSKLDNTLFGSTSRAVPITPFLEEKILIIEDYLSNDMCITNKVDTAIDAVIAAGGDISRPRSGFSKPKKLSREEFVSAKFHAGKVTRILEGLEFDDLSTEDQCDVIYDINECTKLCGFKTSLEGMKSNKFRSIGPIVVARSTFNKVKEFMFESNDTAGALTRELKETYYAIVDAYNHLYKNRRHVNRAPEINIIFNEMKFGLEQPQRGYLNSLDKMRTVFLEDSLLLSLSRTIYRSVETLSVSGRGASDQMVRNVKELQYNFLSAMSAKSRITPSGQEHTLRSIGIMDIQISLDKEVFDIDYDVTKLIPYAPTFEEFHDVFHKVYDINIMALEDKITHTIDAYNSIMRALDKMMLTRENLDIILGVVDGQLDLDTRVLSKVVEQSLKQVKYIADIFEKAADTVQNNHKRIYDETI